MVKTNTLQAIAPQGHPMTMAEALAQIAAQKAEIAAKDAALKAAEQHKRTGQLTIKGHFLGDTKINAKTKQVEACKGNVSVYGLGRYPVTLYKSQWLRLLAVADEIKDYIAANDSKLANKDED